jgi:hypothetical protein
MTDAHKPADQPVKRKTHWGTLLWQARHRNHYNAYMARYMRGYRKRKRAAARRDAM